MAARIGTPAGARPSTHRPRALRRRRERRCTEPSKRPHQRQERRRVSRTLCARLERHRGIGDTDFPKSSPHLGASSSATASTVWPLATIEQASPAGVEVTRQGTHDGTSRAAAPRRERDPATPRNTSSQLVLVVPRPIRCCLRAVCTGTGSREALPPDLLFGQQVSPIPQGPATRHRSAPRILPATLNERPRNEPSGTRRRSHLLSPPRIFGGRHRQANSTTRWSGTEPGPPVVPMLARSTFVRMSSEGS
jgi:hypothetical protein